MKHLLVLFSLLVFIIGAAAPKTQHEGKVKVYVYDYPTHAVEKTVLDDGKQEIELRLPKGSKHELSNEQKIKVKGVRKKEQATEVLEINSDADVEIVSQVGDQLPNSSGPQKIAWFLVTYSDGKSLMSVEAAKAHAAEINNYFLQQSYGSMWYVGIKDPKSPGDVIPVKIALASGGCEIGVISDQAKTAAQAAGYPINEYRGSIYLMVPSPCGGWSGLSGGTLPFANWINGQPTIRVTAHENGHGLGLSHAKREDCPGCGAAGEYSDHTDIMANSAGIVGAGERFHLGWLDRTGVPPIVVTTQPGTFTISALDAPPDGKPKAVKILRSGTTTYWWITLRTCTQYHNGYCGIYVHSGSDGVPGFTFLSSTLLHTWVNLGSDWTLDIGDVFSDYPNARFFSVASIANGEAVIRVTVAPPTLGEGWTLCALANGQCTPPVNATQAAFGANNSFVYKNINQSFICNQDTFQQGDPVPNVPKACYTKSGPVVVVKAPNPVIISIQGGTPPPVIKAPNAVTISINGGTPPPVIKAPNPVLITVK